MIVEQNKLHHFMHGMIHHTEIDGYILPCRFTEAQRNYYDSTAFAGREKSTAGISLEFRTNAKKMTLALRLTDTQGRGQYQYDLWVNGVLTQHKENQFHRAYEEEVLEQAFTDRESTVALFFPNLAAMALGTLTLQDAGYVLPVEKCGIHLAYGDSITQGYYAKFPSLSYTNALSRAWNCNRHNFAIGGERFNPDMIDANLPFSANLVSIAYGTNDWNHLTEEETSRRIPAFLSKIVQLHTSAEIYLFLPIWRGNHAQNSGMGIPLLPFCDKIKQYAQAHSNIHLVHTWKFVPPHGQFFAPDLLHPNDLGFSLYALGLERILPSPAQAAEKQKNHP